MKNIEKELKKHKIYIVRNKFLKKHISKINKFFDDEIESIFEFDPISQKRLNETELDSFTINPSSELIIDNKNLEKFRSKFRSFFPNFRKSQTYEMFSSGMIPSGGEQFLPLFYDNLETLFDDNHTVTYYNPILSNPACQLPNVCPPQSPIPRAT